MKLDRTRLVASTLLPKTNPQRSNQTTSKINPLAPETKKTSGRAGSACSGRAADWEGQFVIHSMGLPLDGRTAYRRN